jgi:prepilin peptidase CpaA
MPHYSAIRILVAVIVVAAAATDLRSRRIPNWLTLPGVCAGLLLNWFISGLPGIGTALTGMMLGFGAYLVLYFLHAMGAGDVKLMAAVGAIVGPANWVAVFIASAIAGGVLAVALMIWKGRVRETLSNTLFIAGELMHFRAPYNRRKDLDVKDPRALNMPHGVAIAAGTMACLLFAVI